MKITDVTGRVVYLGPMLTGWEAEFDEGATAEYTPAEEKARLRANIKSAVGDEESQIGKLADVTALTLVHLLADIVSIAGSDDPVHQTRLEIMQGMAGDVDIVGLAANAIEMINNGDVTITAALKGVDGVLMDCLNASTEVAGLLSEV